ncbi:MAG: Aconitate hydratase B [Sodalis sp.]|nr:MAG: Aconitate hydratase B [Sodalis sp.]
MRRSRPASSPATLAMSPPATSDKGYSLVRNGWPRAAFRSTSRPPLRVEKTSVWSQNTTGHMRRDELKDLTCQGFFADLVINHFATPSPIPSRWTLQTYYTLPDFIMNRGGISLYPGDGISTPG